MTVFKARIQLKSGLRDATVESQTEWEARELLMGQYDLKRTDIKYIKRVEGRTASRSLKAMNDNSDDGEESFLYRAVTGAIGLGFWLAVGFVLLKTMG